MSQGPAAGWYPDPLGRHEHRYFDGSVWTSHVADAGRAAEDPLSPPPPHVEPVGATWEAPHPIVTPPTVAGPPAGGPAAGGPPAGGPPAGGPAAGGPVEPQRPRPGRGALVGALVVVALVLATGVIVGVRLADDDDASSGGTASGAPTALDEMGEGTPASPLYGYLELGAADAPVSTPVGPTGATWTTASGVELSVPEGAYTSELTFTTSETEITGQTFGELVSPAGKLLTVDNGGVEAAVPVELTFPVDADDDEVALAVFYDANAGRIEPMPIIAAEDGTITTITRHFSSIFVTLVDLALLVDDVIDSGFRPGVDDWDFVNYGSWVAPGGHCSGQSLSALWYYVQQHLANGAPSLFDRFEDRVRNVPYGPTPTLDADDRDAYRFASMVQDDEAKAYDATERAYDDATKAKLGRAQFYAFAYAILTTGEPQYVGMYRDAGGGHAMIVYAVTEDALLIADPNFPGAYRTITYDPDTGALGPYTSSLKAGDPDMTFESIGYYAKTALVDWNGLGGRWEQFLDGSIGAGAFPTATLEVREVDEDGDESWVPLVDGYEVEEDQDSITVRMAGIDTWNARLNVYQWTDLTVTGVWDQAVSVPLEKGMNRLGFEYRGWSWSDSTDAWVDFERIRVQRGDPEEAPLDLVFVIDLTSSMEDDIAGVKEAASEILATVAETNDDWRVAVLGYRDVGDTPMFEDYEFTDDQGTAQGYIDALVVAGGGDTPEAVYEALSRAIDASTIGDWRNGANKQTILMGDAPGHDPGSGGETPESVAREAELADPVVIQSIVIGNSGYIDPEAQADFANLSSLTAGQTFTAADAAAVPAALEQSIGATALTPTTRPSDDGTDWARLVLLVAALVLLVGGAGVVVWRLLLPPVVPAAAWRRIGAATAVGVLGLAGVGWWTFSDDDGGGTSDVRAGLTHAGPSEDDEKSSDGSFPSVTTPPTSTAAGTTTVGTTVPGVTTTEVATTLATTIPITLPTTVPATLPASTAPATVAPTTAPATGPAVTPPAGVDTSTWQVCVNTEQGWTVSYPADWFVFTDPSGVMDDCSVFAPFDMTGADPDDAYNAAYVNIGRLLGYDLTSYTQAYVTEGSWVTLPTPAAVTIDGRAGMTYGGVIPADTIDEGQWGDTEYVVDLATPTLAEVGWMQALLPMSYEYDIAVEVLQGMVSTVHFTT